MCRSGSGEVHMNAIFAAGCKHFLLNPQAHESVTRFIAGMSARALRASLGQLLVCYLDCFRL